MMVDESARSTSTGAPKGAHAWAHQSFMRPPSRGNGKHVSFRQQNLAAGDFEREMVPITSHKLSGHGGGQFPIVQEIDELPSSDDEKCEIVREIDELSSSDDEKLVMFEMAKLEDGWDSDSGNSSEEENSISSTKRTSSEVKRSDISTEPRSPEGDLEAQNPAPARAIIRPRFQLIDSEFFEPERRFGEALQHCWNRQLNLPDFFWLVGGLGVIMMLLTLWGYFSYQLWDKRMV